MKFPKAYAHFIDLATDAVVNPRLHAWSQQGLGMYRAYLDPLKIARVHVWSKVPRVENVSEIHDHPWDFYSYILRGTNVNTRYVKSPTGEPYNETKIFCGTEAKPLESSQVLLKESAVELLWRGDTYHMHASELHKSDFSAGSISVIVRIPTTRDVDHANCYHTGDWVSARPSDVNWETVASAIG